MSRADELRRQADILEQHDEIVAAYEAALDAYRADQSDENKAAYQTAAAALQEWRAIDRADRAGTSVLADTVTTDSGATLYREG